MDSAEKKHKMENYMPNFVFFQFVQLVTSVSRSVVLIVTMLIAQCASS